LLEMFKKVWQPSVNVLLTFSITLSIFPGMISEIKSDTFLNTESWFTVLLITLFDVFDCLGRLSSSCTIFHETPKLIYGLSICRLLFYPFFVLCIKPRLITSPVVPIIFTILLGVTNGCFSSLMFVYGSKAVKLQEREVAINIITAFVTFGLGIGSFLGFGLAHVLL